MSEIEKIKRKIDHLPKSKQKKVLDFIAHLSKKKIAKGSKKEDTLWSKFSLAAAMEGISDTGDPEYTLKDLKERWH